MTCADFVARFSEFFDGAAPEEHLREAEEHLSQCPSCRRYRQVVEQGAALLRTFPAPEIPEDFSPRLQHRIYHVEAVAALRSAATSSAAPPMAVVGMALVLAAVAWAPTLRPSAPEVLLPVIEVSRPPMPLRYRSAPAYPFNASRVSHAARPAGFWDDAPTLLFENSILSHRSRNSSVQHTGLDQDR